MSGSWWRSQVGASFSCPPGLPASLLPPSCHPVPSFLPSSLLLSLLPFFPSSFPLSFPLLPPFLLPSRPQAATKPPPPAAAATASGAPAKGIRAPLCPQPGASKHIKTPPFIPFQRFSPHKCTQGGARRAPKLKVSQRGKWRKARGSSGLVTWKSSAAFETLGTPSGEEKASARLPRNVFFFSPQTPRGKGYF